MLETQALREKEPVPELTLQEHNGIQTKLIERFISGGGTETDWVNKYAKRFRELTQVDESIRLLIHRDPDMALDVIEEALTGKETN